MAIQDHVVKALCPFPRTETLTLLLSRLARVLPLISYVTFEFRYDIRAFCLVIGNVSILCTYNYPQAPSPLSDSLILWVFPPIRVMAR